MARFSQVISKRRQEWSADSATTVIFANSVTPITRGRRLEVRGRNRAAAICIVDGYILLNRRIRPGFGEYYVIPGGGVEPGEDPKSAVRREIREETGLRVQVRREVWRGTTPKGSTHFYFLVSAPRLPVALPKDAEENHPARVAAGGTTTPRWVPVVSVRRLRLLPPALKPHIAHALTRGFPTRLVRIREL
ncbi:MAG: NUDIX domain-containing protein [Candidatus Kerfeldbacteria bacterium]|nr:NUDIX domain-containing protein [Candidatus Kerfeldbacteria bacterium]